MFQAKLFALKVTFSYGNLKIFYQLEFKIKNFIVGLDESLGTAFECHPVRKNGWLSL